MILENDLNRWPDTHGVASTATIVSHYMRRGGYRVHAAAVDARGSGSTYTHSLVKGARDRRGEEFQQRKEGTIATRSNRKCSMPPPTQGKLASAERGQGCG